MLGVYEWDYTQLMYTIDDHRWLQPMPAPAAPNDPEGWKQDLQPWQFR